MNTIQKLNELSSLCDSFVEMARGDQMRKVIRQSASKIPKHSSIDAPLRYTEKADSVASALRKSRALTRARRGLYDAYEAADGSGSKAMAKKVRKMWEDNAIEDRNHIDRAASLVLRPKKSN